MPELHPPIALELSENETRVKYILEEANKPDYSFPEVRTFCLELLLATLYCNEKICCRAIL